MPRRKTTAVTPPQTLPAAPKPKREVIVTTSPIPTLDTAAFEHMVRVATAMARANLIPTSLSMDGNKELPFETVMSRCLMIVNQAVRWGLDPWSVAACTSVIKGRLCYEGKLVTALLDAKLGVDLDYTFNDGTGDDFGVTVSATVNGRVREISGTVGEWKTTGDNSPWSRTSTDARKRMLRYRGAREWARAYASAVLLGIYTDDEMEGLEEDTRARRALPTGSGIINRIGGDGGSQGFDPAKTMQAIENAAAGVAEDPEDDQPAEPATDPKQIDLTANAEEISDKLTPEEIAVLKDLKSELSRSSTELEVGATENLFSAAIASLSDAAKIEASDAVEKRMKAINKGARKR